VKDDAEDVLAELDPEWLAALNEAESLEEKSADGCALCHVDVADEMHGTPHHGEEIGCVDCHGESRAHVRDENNDVKPDEIFARADVDRACRECHDCSRVPAEDTPPAARRVCTDCHGVHRFERL